MKEKGKEREDAGISGGGTRRNAIKSSKYLNAYYIYIYIIHLYLVPPEPDVILNDDFTSPDEHPGAKESHDQAGDDMRWRVSNVSIVIFRFCLNLSEDTTILFDKMMHSMFVSQTDGNQV